MIRIETNDGLDRLVQRMTAASQEALDAVDNEHSALVQAARTQAPRERGRFARGFQRRSTHPPNGLQATAYNEDPKTPYVRIGRRLAWDVLIVDAWQKRLPDLRNNIRAALRGDRG